jgi:putative Mn2+ efflux pump MntP
MNLVSTALLCLAMSTDAFAAAVAKGTTLRHPRWSEALRAGLIFGTIEAATPLVGWLIGRAASAHVAALGPWISFGLLVGLGGHMVFEAWRGGDDDEEEDEGPEDDRTRHGPSHSLVSLALTGLATSLDAMAVGVGLAFMDVAIVPVSIAIGLTTCAMVTLGMMLGRWLGGLVGRAAEIAGGLVLAGIGTGILVQHLWH